MIDLSQCGVIAINQFYETIQELVHERYKKVFEKTIDEKTESFKNELIKLQNALNKNPVQIVQDINISQPSKKDTEAKIRQVVKEAEKNNHNYDRDQDKVSIFVATKLKTDSN